MAAEEGELVHKQVVLLLFKAVQKLQQPWKKTCWSNILFPVNVIWYVCA